MIKARPDVPQARVGDLEDADISMQSTREIPSVGEGSLTSFE